MYNNIILSIVSMQNDDKIINLIEDYVLEIIKKNNSPTHSEIFNHLFNNDLIPQNLKNKLKNEHIVQVCDSLVDNNTISRAVNSDGECVYFINDNHDKQINDIIEFQNKIIKESRKDTDIILGIINYWENKLDKVTTLIEKYSLGGKEMNRHKKNNSYCDCENCIEENKYIDKYIVEEDINYINFIEEYNTNEKELLDCEKQIKMIEEQIPSLSSEEISKVVEILDKLTQKKEYHQIKSENLFPEKDKIKLRQLEKIQKIISNKILYMNNLLTSFINDINFD